MARLVTSFGYFCATLCAAERDYWARVVTRKLFGEIVACVLFNVVLLHTLPCHQGRPVRHQGLRLCCQSANESEVQHCASQMSAVICYITDQCSVRTMCSFQFWVGNNTNVRGKRGVFAAAWRNSTLVGQFRVLARDGRCGSVTYARLGQQFLQFVFWCESVQGGPATCV